MEFEKEEHHHTDKTDEEISDYCDYCFPKIIIVESASCNIRVDYLSTFY